MGRTPGLLIGLVALLAVLLGLANPAAAHATPSSSTAITYTYDGHDRSSMMPAPAVERGPPVQLHRVTTYDPAGFQAGGELARPNTPTSPGIYDYDDLARFAPTASGSRGAEEQVSSAEPGPVDLPRSDVATKSLSALEQGTARVPGAWGEGIANSKGVGTRWFDPAAPQTNGIRIDAGIPGSNWASQQVDHVVVRSGGRILGPDGKPIVGALRDNPQAHIPLSDWLNWTSWNAP